VTEISRARNRRGEGGRLREEILAGATSLLEETGSEDAVTLRAVARQIGISAPSIYAHFPDREAIVDAIVDSAFHDFNTAIYEAIDGVTDPLARLRAGCAAYLRFAAERPNRYKMLFDRRDLLAAASHPLPAIRTESFDWLVQGVQACAEAGLSRGQDPYLDSTAIWAALHGYATLHARLDAFPWPAQDALLDRIVFGLAGINPAGRASAQ
jgi:AcrR family transcriptional regulator